MVTGEISRISMRKNNKFIITLITIGITILTYILYLLTVFFIKPDSEYSVLIFLLSWIGLFAFGFISFTWRKITGHLFSPYIIFVIFFFLFNFGQPIMWAFGVNMPTEIGSAPLYPGYGIATDADIVYAQSLVIISSLMFHFGALLSTANVARKKINGYNKESKLFYKFDNQVTLKVMYYVCLVIGTIAIPVTLVAAYNDLRVASTYGYRALYYSEFARKGFSVTGLITFWFFPCIAGLLIGSKYKKSVRIFVYAIFVIYIILNILAGDRGPWVYKMVILFWLSHMLYRPIKPKRLLKYLLLSVPGLYIMDAIVSLRNTGITFEAVVNALSYKNSSIIGAFFEMGASMKPVVFLIKYGWDIWPYSNTYLLALGGLVTNKFLDIFNIHYEVLDNFFKDYLAISWGPGFSIVAEALINFGPIFSPIFMIVLGYIIAALTNINYSVAYNNKPLRILFVASTLNALISINRSGVHIHIKEWLYGVFLLCLMIKLIKELLYKKKFKQKNDCYTEK